MLRHVLSIFRQALKLQTATATAPVTRAQQFPEGFLPHRTIFNVSNAEKSTETKADDDEVIITTETDPECIVPYSVKKETGTSVSALVDAMRNRFNLTDADVRNIINNETVQRNYRSVSIITTMELLCGEGVTKRSLIEYPWLLTINSARMKQKIILLKTMPMRNINHFVPFLRLTLPRLRRLVSALNKESNAPTGNRVYYISRKLQVDPAVAAKYLSKRLFVLEMPFEMFEQTLELMINYNISPLNILKDLWAFRYMPKSVELRLERARLAKKDKIMPWMVRCPESILQRSLKLSLDELNVLADKANVVEYLAARLDFNVTEMKAIMDKHPQVHTVRVTKIKEVLDYLLNEAGFTRIDIAQTPRILCHSLNTTKERLEELKFHGCRPSSLVIVCRSKREYGKFMSAWIETQNNINESVARTDMQPT